MNSIAWWPTLIVLGIATVSDFRSRRIPNWLVVPFLIAGILASSLEHGWAGAGHSLSGVALAVAVTGLFCFLRGMGLGDLKLCAAVGAWIWPSQLTVALVVTGLAGGVMALIWALWTKSLGASLNGAGDLVLGAWRRGLRAHETLVLDNPAARKMPYAPAIAIGTIVSFFAV
jgi:prepilin peptidase CpaA